MGLFDAGASDIAAYMASQEQQDAAAKAQKDQLEYLQGVAAEQRAAAAGGVSMLNYGTQDATDALNWGFDRGDQTLGQGYRDAMGTLGASGASALGAMGANYDAAGNAMSNAYSTSMGQFGQGLDSLGAGYGQAQGAMGQVAGLQRFIDPASQGYGASNVMGAQDRVGGLLDQQGGMYGGFEQDPGYQFRRQQGEQAIMRAGSAQGGRMGGDKLKALAEFNQNLASQEFGNFANRRQAEVGALSGSDAQRAGLLMNQAGRRDSALSQQQQAQMALAQAGIGGQQGLSGLYAQQGGAQAGYLGDMAGITGQYGANMGNMYQNRAGAESGLYQTLGQSAANLQYGYGQQQAGRASQFGSDLASLLYGSAQDQANIHTGGAAGAAGVAGQMAGAYGSYVPYAGAGAASLANSGAAFNNQVGSVVETAAKMYGGG